MSEIPAMCFMLVASYTFLIWLEVGGAFRCWLAFALATVAFYCRISTCGMLPGWLLYLLITGQGRRLRSTHPFMAGTAHLILGSALVILATKYAPHEVAADGKMKGFTWHNINYFFVCVPPMLAWGSTLAAAAGLLAYAASGGRSHVGTFWACWVLGQAAYKIVMPTSYEVRHFFGVVPALAGLASCLFTGRDSGRARIAAIAIVGLGITANLRQLPDLPRGLVGYKEVSRALARLEKGGNIFLACPQDQDLMFRYRSEAPESRRLLVRSDRTLAIRLADYAGIAPTILAERGEDVLETLVRVRSRYLVTAVPEKRATNDYEENKLTHRTLVERPQDFRLLGTYDLLEQFERPGKRWKIYVWEYLGELPDGPTSFSVIIPTAKMELRAK